MMRLLASGPKSLAMIPAFVQRRDDVLMIHADFLFGRHTSIFLARTPRGIR